MADEYLLQLAREAVERWRQIPPKERFRAMVERGVIDEQGRVLIHMPLWANRPDPKSNGAEQKPEDNSAHEEPPPASS